MVNQIIKKPKGYSWVSSRGTNLSGSTNFLIFKKRNGLGKLLKLKKEIKYIVPNDMKVKKIENNKPNLNSITLTLSKK